MAWVKTYRGDEAQRINKWLAHEGVCSRREAEDLIGRGLVSIDGVRVQDVGRKIESGQTLTLADAGMQTGVTVVLNKPVGFVSAQPEQGQIPAARLVTRANLHAGEMPDVDKSSRLAPLGRLDQDSRGLLLLSEDGVLAKAVIGPESKLDKEYKVRVAGPLNERKLGLLRHGLSLDGRKLRPAKVNLIGDQQLRFVLTEGRNRQIRRMCEAVELEVTDLLRVRIGPLQLGALPEGKWRALAAAERESLIQASR